jgi:hypothetical protein
VFIKSTDWVQYHVSHVSLESIDVMGARAPSGGDVVIFEGNIFGSDKVPQNT